MPQIAGMRMSELAANGLAIYGPVLSHRMKVMEKAGWVKPRAMPG